MAIKFKVNGKPVSLEQSRGDMPLLWYLREVAGYKGTKFGCGVGQCGACTVHYDGKAVRSCMIPVSSLESANITTIEGLAREEGHLHSAQRAWLELDVAQCGYCQAGQIMATAALLAQIPDPSDKDIEEQITNICRCGTYVRIRKAIKRAAELARAEEKREELM